MPCGRKMVQPGLEARLAQNCQPNSCATHLHVQAVAPIQELGVCVCAALSNVMTPVKSSASDPSLGAGVSANFYNFREHFCMSSIYVNKATTQRKSLSRSLEMSSILLACWLQGYVLFVQTL